MVAPIAADGRVNLQMFKGPDHVLLMFEAPGLMVKLEFTEAEAREFKERLERHIFEFEDERRGKSS